MTAMAAAALELQGITRTFPGVLANDNVNLRVQAGTVHGLVGENGTGKTTLMRIAYGLLRPDQGTVHIRGQSLGSGGQSAPSMDNKFDLSRCPPRRN